MAIMWLWVTALGWGRWEDFMCSNSPSKVSQTLNSWSLFTVPKQHGFCYCFKLSSIKAREYECEVKDINHKNFLANKLAEG